MKVDPYYVWLLKGFAMATVAVLLAVLVFYMWVAVGVLDNESDGYYTHHPQSGHIIGKNVSRMVFYVETNTSMKTVHVDVDTYYQYDIGDRYEWVISVFHRYSRITNMTMIHSW